MEIDSGLLEVHGAKEVVEWFGRWPNFHDAEVVSVFLDRGAESKVRIHAFNMLAETNEKGHYRTNQHAVVCFILTNILAMDFADFNHQNVLSGLGISNDDSGISLELGCCYGLYGSIKAEQVRVELEPGIPDGSVYGPGELTARSCYFVRRVWLD